MISYHSGDTARLLVLMRRLLAGGLMLMGTSAVASAIWPAVATAVSIVFTAVIGLVVLVPVLIGARWMSTALAARRAFGAVMTTGATPVTDLEPVAPTLAQLRGTA